MFLKVRIPLECFALTKRTVRTVAMVIMSALMKPMAAPIPSPVLNVDNVMYNMPNVSVYLLQM